jgi:diguanylate cyclase (GGDEF)-like protein
VLALAIAYASSATGFLLQYFSLPVGSFAVEKIIASAMFTIAVCSISGAVVARYGQTTPYAWFAVLGLGGLVGFSWFVLVQPDLVGRVYAINLSLGGITLLVAAKLRPVRKNGPIEMALFLLSLVSACNFFVRPALVIGLDGTLATREEIYASAYWMTTLLSNALFSLLIALSLLAGVALDMMGTLRTESHTDPLSKLLNRRGFEDRATALLESGANANLPMALVLADLDHFKNINDMYGHAAGDRVIIDFAGKLLATAGKRGIVGRIGGEEFAVLLPLTELAAARLLAEAVRTVFSAESVNGLPLGIRVTASFGVAARSGSEGLAPLMRRADEALYKAKQNGRDSVRISYQRPEIPPYPEARLG